MSKYRKFERRLDGKRVTDKSESFTIPINGASNIDAIEQLPSFLSRQHWSFAAFDNDGYFECDLKQLASGQLERELNLLDPFKVWTWDPSSRRSYRGYPKRQLPMWHVYRVELYPHVGQLSGIRDRFGYELEFPSAFRQSRRNSQPKGIVKIGATP